MKLVHLALITFPICVFADSGLPNQPYIYVQGKAEVEKPADFVTLRFDVVARATDETKANAEVQLKANKVFALAKEQKIPNADVIAESLRSEPQYENEETYQRRGKIIGYSVARPFRVKVRDVAIFPKLSDDIIAATGAEFSEIDGGLEKETDIQKELWTKAVQNAHEQAEKTLKSVGMKIDSVFAISPVPVLEIASTMFPKEQNYGETERVIAAEKAPSQYHVAPITVTQVVHVIYLISPEK
jgi:uncharacterized protein YggE